MSDRPPAPPPPFDPRQVRAIVFDLDGTLVDSYEAIAASLNYARARCGLAPLPPADVRQRVGRGLESLIAELVGPEHVADGVRWFREHYAEAWAGGTRALPGAVGAVRKLHAAGYGLGVASNKPARFSGLILEQLGLRACFDSVQGPDLAGSAKPDPTMIRLCLAEMRVAPANAVYVGDMVLDVESAARAGLPVVLVAGGSSPAEDLRRTGQLVLDGPQELGRLFPGP